MRRRVWFLAVSLLVMLLASVASAAELPILPGPIIVNPPILNPDLVLNLEPIPVAFSAVANRYTGVDPATTFDLNGDLVGDLKVTATEVIMQNGAQVQMIEPPALNLDSVNLMPAAGYGAKEPLQLSRVYAARLSGDSYAKFMVLQASPKVTLWLMHGTPTSSILTADGQNSEAKLSWDPLEDAALGYNIYRYEINDNSYTVTQLNDFTVEETSFIDRTAGNRYYIYVVQAVKAGGSPGSLTTTASVFVTHQARKLVVPLGGGSADLDGSSVPMGTPAEIRNGLMMVPASLLEHTGATVTVNDGTGRVTLSRRLENVTYTVVMTVDSPDYTWNGTAYGTDVPPYKKGSAVMVPLRVVAPVLGLGVSFNSEDRTATVGWFE